MNEQDRLAIAASAFAKLEKMHSAFMQRVATLDNRKVNCGEVSVQDNELIVTCLGKQLLAHHRLIARDGLFRAIEYAFFTTHTNENLHVCTIYLEADDDLYADAMQRERVCGSMNVYLATHVVESVASALLKSPVFAARE